MTHKTAASEPHCTARRCIGVGRHGLGRSRLLANGVALFCGQRRLCGRRHGGKLLVVVEEAKGMRNNYISYKRTAVIPRIVKDKYTKNRQRTHEIQKEI